MKYRLCAAALAIMTLCNGCMNSVRLNDRAIVQVLGIDREDDVYYTTMQIFSAATPGADGADPKPVLARAQGRTIAEAMTNAAQTYGKQMFLGGLRVVVFGKEAAQEGLGEAYSFFNKLHQIPPTLPLAVAKDQAREIVGAVEDDPSLTGDGILDLMENARKTGAAPRCSLMDAIAGGAGEFTAAMPLLQMTEEEQRPQESSQTAFELSFEQQARQTAAGASEEQSSSQQQDGQGGKDGGEKSKEQKRLRAHGTALFYQDKMEKTLDARETRGLMWFRNTIAAATLSAVAQDARIAAVTHSQRAEIETELVGDNPVFTLLLRVRASLVETYGPGAQDVSEEEEEQIRLQLEKSLRQEIEHAVSACLRQGYDPLMLGSRLRQSYPSFWEEHDEENEMESILAAAGYDVRVELDLDREGAGK